jgi:hypothetical protein
MDLTFTYTSYNTLKVGGIEPMIEVWELAQGQRVSEGYPD